MVVALDAKNHIVTNYAGTVHLTSSDPSAILPADYVFQAGDRGSHVFAVTFESKGRQSLVATDMSNGAMGADAFHRRRASIRAGGRGGGDRSGSLPRAESSQSESSARQNRK